MMRSEIEEAKESGGLVNASPRLWWSFIAGYILLAIVHAVVLKQDFPADMIDSDIIVGLTQWLTLAALIWRWRHASFPNAIRWGLLFAAVAFVNLANCNDLAIHIGKGKIATPGASIFCDAVYVALVLLCCSATFRGHRMRATNAIDGIMAVVLTVFFFIQTFSLLSLGGTENPEDILFIVRMFDILGVFMTVCATVRLLGAERSQRRHFFFVLASFLLTSTVLASARNRLLLTHYSQYLELLLLPQFVVLGLLCLRRLPRWLENYRPKPSMVHVTESLSPIFLALGLLGVSIDIWSSHATLAVTGVCIAVIGYGVRNVISESQQMAAERSLLKAQEELEGLVVTDPLTGIANRRGLDAALQRMWNRVQSSEMQLSVLMIDIDHFKRFNDNYGHDLGDRCLTAVANCLNGILTPLGCFVGRNGGEEFAALLPATTLEQACEIGEVVRSSVENIRLDHGGESLQVTISVGLANSEISKVASGKELLVLADEALFDAKNRGRNRVESRERSTPISGKDLIA